MTPRQSDVFTAIDLFWKKHGHSPSIDEIMMMINCRSRSNVSRMISQLCDLGILKKLPNRRRTVRPSYVNFRNMND